MKIKIKYSSTKKFVLNFEGSCLGELIEATKKFVADTYGDDCPNLGLSLNGKDPLQGLDVPVRELGVVPMDLLTVVTLPTAAASAPAAAAASDPAADATDSGPAAAAIDSGPVAAAIDSGPAAAATDSGPAAAATDGGPAAAATDSAASTPSSDAATGACTSNKTEDSSGPSTLLEVRSCGGAVLPSSLVQLVHHCRPAGGGQLVNLLVHITMLECGWRIAGADVNHGSEASSATESPAVPVSPPSGWEGLVASLNYTHASFSNFSCTVVLVSMGTNKQILVSFPNQDVQISTDVNVDDYVQMQSDSSGGGCVQLSDIRNVSSLAQKLRNELLVPLQLAAHRVLGLPSPFHLAGLPSEILWQILRNLDVKSSLNLSCCSRRLHDAVVDNSLWQFYYARDLGQFYSHTGDRKSSTWMTNLNWMELYKNRHQERGRKQEQDRYVDFPDHYPQRGPPVPQIYPIHPPGLPFQPNPVGPYPTVPDPSPPFNPYNDPDSPYFGGDIPNRPPNPLLPHNPPGWINPFGPQHGGDPLNPFGPHHGGDPLNPFGDPDLGGLGPSLPGRPRNPRRPPQGGPGGVPGFRYI